MTRDQLLSEIAAFLAEDGVDMTESTFGRMAVNDGKLVPRLRNGGGLTLDTAEKIQTFIRDYRRRPKNDEPTVKLSAGIAP